MSDNVQKMIANNLEQIRNIYLKTFEELTSNQSNIEIVIRNVLEGEISEDDALEKLTEYVEYAEKLQKDFSLIMQKNLDDLLAMFPDQDSEEVQGMRSDLSKIYKEMEDGVSDFVSKVKELYKV